MYSRKPMTILTSRAAIKNAQAKSVKTADYEPTLTGPADLHDRMVYVNIAGITMQTVK